MPKLGFDMAEGTLVRWVKREGETVAKGEVLAEIETDKATVEVEASVSGTVRRLLVGRTHRPCRSGRRSPSSGSRTSRSTTLARPCLPAPASRAGCCAAPARPSGSGHASAHLRGGEGVPEACALRPWHAALASEQRPRSQPACRHGPGGPDRQEGCARPRRRRLPAFLAGPGETIPLTRLRSGHRPAHAAVQAAGAALLPDGRPGRRTAWSTLRAQLNAVLPEDARLSVNDFIVKAAALALRDVPGPQRLAGWGLASCATPRSTSGSPWPWRTVC